MQWSLDVNFVASASMHEVGVAGMAMLIRLDALMRCHLKGCRGL